MTVETTATDIGEFPYRLRKPLSIRPFDETLGYPVFIIVDDTSGVDTAWFWTTEWQAKEREADKDIESGEFSTIRTVDELFEFFDGEKKQEKTAHKRSR